MKLSWVAAATVALAATATAQESGAAVGSTPTYSFGSPIVNGLGVKSLSDLQGRPVLVEFWGTH